MLYRSAVQHPEAEVAFLERVYMHYFEGEQPTLLREDFAGTCAISSAWVMMDEDNRALAIEIDYPTAVWADKFISHEIQERSEDVIILVDDVMNVNEPEVEIVASMNFSTLIYHSKLELIAYFKHVRKCLLDNGIFVMDVFGGAGSKQVGVQERAMVVPGEQDLKIKYQWEQRSYDARNQRIDCRIHFERENGERLVDAFCYDWRLWSLADLQAMMIEAGFDDSEVWCDVYNTEIGQSDGYYKPADVYPDRQDWIAYVVGVKRG
ncbi:hypothetical protein KS4_11170 [Poriferisphaera corsica]|uniref:Class I SAM-dependent methyltransferase n=2 Tax=Poriferisphaera corsica TaxID=2528020 RepID=A0A517YS90_9BACT|nr:hypothetical protein KS4_11170 [Poriferisphaera corsica]